MWLAGSEAEQLTRQQLWDRAVELERERLRLRKALEELYRTLHVPAAEYVPAIPDAWKIIREALGEDWVNRKGE